MPRDYKNRPRAGRAQKKREPVLQRWRHALGGFALGLCVAVGAYVEGRYPGTFLASTGDPIPVPNFDIATAEELAEERTTPARKPRFEFYSLLPEMEVSVPVEKTEPRASPKVQPEPTTAESEPPARRLPSAERARRLLAGEDPAKVNAPVFGQIKPMAPAAERSVVARPVASAESHTRLASAPRADGFMVQLGSFRQLSDADRMKANLALTGHRVVIRTAVMADRSKRHRVQIGPFTSREAALRASSGVARGEPLILRVQS